MSTFTQFNYPQTGSPASVKQITELINVYNEVISTLNTLREGLSSHVDSKLTKDGDNPHEAKTYIANQLSSIQSAITNIQNEYVTNNALTTKLATKASASDLSSLTDKVQKCIDDLAQEVSDRSSSYTSLDNQMSNLQSDFRTLRDTQYYNLNNLVTKYINMVNDYVQYTDWFDTRYMTLNDAVPVGTGAQTDTGTQGLYVLGMLSTEYSSAASNLEQTYKPKPGMAFIKYVDDSRLDAKIDMTVTSMNNGVLSVQAAMDSEWEGLRFHLLKLSTPSGKSNVYLAVSCKAFADKTLEPKFYVSGFNFIPAANAAFERPNVASATIQSICYVDVTANGFYSNALSINISQLITAEEIHELFEEYRGQ